MWSLTIHFDQTSFSGQYRTDHMNFEKKIFMWDTAGSLEQAR